MELIKRLFGRRKRLEERFASLENKYAALESKYSDMEKKVAELSKRTISQKTTQDDPVPFSQIVDEWLNGAEEEGNGD